MKQDKNSDRAKEARDGRFSRRNLIDAQAMELLGMCRGILADANLVDAEIVALEQWIATHGAALPDWPFQHLARRVRGVLADGEIEDDERVALQEFITDLIGDADPTEYSSTTLPLTEPPPHIEYVGRRFCLTGVFVYGGRTDVESTILDQGGAIAAEPKGADYLVIGATATRSWRFGTHGRKIEVAIALQASGKGPMIVSEEHWVTSLC